MKKIFALCGSSLLTVLLTVAAYAQEVKTEYFMLDLPSGWTQPKPVRSHPAGTTAVFTTEDGKTAVNILVLNTDAPLQDIYVMHKEKMADKGYVITDEKCFADERVMEFIRNGHKGTVCIASNGRQTGMIIIVGSLAAGRELLRKSFTPVDPRLFSLPR